MAGANKLLKDGQILFRAGDQSDGMYLIRRGELKVYLEQDGKEVTLTTVGAGGMIGEMALFDNQPRSASVKAVKDVEVTLISSEDFNKLMKQIPKWFVSLMTALSGRLRQTNDRLKKLESATGGAPAKGKPYQSVIRMLNIAILLWHKDGEKDGKDTVLQKATTEQAMVLLFGEDAEKVKALFETLVQLKILGTRQDSYKNVVFTAQNRGILSILANFISDYTKKPTGVPCISASGLALLRVLERMTLASPYDSAQFAIDDLIKEGKRDGMDTSGFGGEMKFFQALAAEEVRVVKTSTGVGLKTSKKEISNFVRNHEALAAIYRANLM